MGLYRSKQCRPRGGGGKAGILSPSGQTPRRAVQSHGFHSRGGRWCGLGSLVRSQATCERCIHHAVLGVQELPLGVQGYFFTFATQAWSDACSTCSSLRTSHSAHLPTPWKTALSSWPCSCARSAVCCPLYRPFCFS